MTTRKKALRCPTCRTLILERTDVYPFCSDRCQRIDLGKWASGDYKIRSPILDPEVLEGLADAMPRQRRHDDDGERSPEQQAADMARRLLGDE
jgi:endogenous inhibitor of DNA gyrase (YacG/DUF329 family)